jgi:hypothetical protein
VIEVDILTSALALCEPGWNMADYVGEYRFFEATSCFVITRTGIPLLAMIVYGAIAIPIQLRTGSVTIPAVLLLLTGGATMATIAAPAISIATIVLIMAVPGAVTLLLYAYSR